LNGVSSASRPHTVWTGQAVFPTRRERLTGAPGMAKAFADLTLDGEGGRMVFSVLWVFNEPVPEIEFRWDEVESITRVAWFWFSRGIKFRLRRGVMENNRCRAFYFFTRKKNISRILDFAGGAASGSPSRPTTSYSCGRISDLAGFRPGLNF